LRVLGRIEHKAPWILGGSARLSRRYYNRALDLAPDNTVTLIYAAELALDSDDFKRAVELLERVVNRQPDSEWEFENRRDVLVAQELLEQLRGSKWEKG
jgi:tetratricopeptide (TPR) repeat protein